MNVQILDKIEPLFWEKSFSEVSMDDAAKALWIKKASLYYHFESKEKMFLDVIRHSFDKRIFDLNEAFLEKDLKKKLSRIIESPYMTRNLFSIVSQKWYCRIDSVRDEIQDRNREVFEIFHEHFSKNHSFSRERSALLDGLLNDLSKRYCTFGCSNPSEFSWILNEIIKIYF